MKSKALPEGPVVGRVSESMEGPFHKQGTRHHVGLHIAQELPKERV